MIGKLLSAAVVVAMATCQAQAQVQARVQVTEYKGLCEASAGAFIDDDHFVAASDETNRLQLYRRGNPDPIGSGIDMEPFTSFDKSDLEGAARIGDRVYWASSHSFNSAGEDKPKRKVLFATSVVSQDGKPTLVAVGTPVKTLGRLLASATGFAAKTLNAEALAATPGGGLLFGFRAPLRNNEALVVAFENPAEVVDRGLEPRLRKAFSLKLGGRGIRSMDLVSRDPVRYVIVAGPVADAATGFSVFEWAGPNTQPREITGLDLGRIKPEGAMAVPGQAIVQLLSDDGDVCSDEDDAVDKRRFRSIDIKLD